MNILWLQAAGCGGCTMSLLCAENPGVFDLLADAGLNFLWHPALSEQTGSEVRALLSQIEDGSVPLDILCVEGSILTGPKGTGTFQMLSGTGRSMLDWVTTLAPRAAHVVAVGTCATYGGMTSAGGNPSGAIGLQYDGSYPGGALAAEFRGRAGLPVINVAGCPTHPDWVTETLLLIAAEALRQDDLDRLNRPLFYAENLVHHACPKNEFYEYKASAEKPGQMGCMMEHLGCVGTQAVGDCNIRGWNGGSSCTKAGYACINCTAPEFEEPHHPFTQTPKFAGIPVGLPSDMPKAWFMALASLSKAATPKRLAENAVSDRVRIAPTLREGRK
ncbi:HupU protein [Phaeobacter gallaeciensis]|uniref:NADH-quinone oxidoreductase subunit B family protein n=1 Tax=Phaeobacter gallaeciensis TaxID=60890 RepID=UPI00237F23E5|nr:HupU protein [Phaeobacter gallaeciensis]MDE4100009.1 HupU protein [Phaeobacter gallaeciensis]MDE4108799.1 HupU protein [Phaeobacter gallaeciensis]MDE4113245.1 HupU protein [Phaeobacter gallaeciensis]MDE4117686.1 HupU protein [Phaeobacter gallaeciensis]MDE4122189.1 HupU protein [Phaeobacter gallaeciensis]